MTVREDRLASGLRVVTEPMPHLESASVGVWVDAGARHERPEQHGVAHLLEHMAFKGTERRSAQAIAEEIEAVGGQLNAYTGREHTAYYVRTLKDDVPLALDILADILQHSSFDEDELARERDVVIQEIAQANDTPDDIVFDRLQEAAYPEQPIGRSILGTADLVAGHDSHRLKGYLAGHYAAPRMVLAAAGGIDPDDVLARADALFSDLPALCERPPDTTAWSGGDHRESRDIEQAHIVLGFDGVSYHDDAFYAMQVLATVLGGGMSSRLFQEVRERRGLAYSVFSFASSFDDGGLFGVYAGTAPESLGELVPVICDEMAKLAEAVEEEEVLRARAQLKAGLLMSMESSISRIEQLGRQMHIHGRPLDAADIIAKVDAVDAAAVRRACQHLMACSAPAVAAVGPVAGLDSYDKIAARFGTS